MDRAEEILKFWFGRVEQTVVPSEKRSRIWFSDSIEVAEQIKLKFGRDLDAVKSGDYDHWILTPRGQLALIIVLDQFPRHIYLNSLEAFSQDEKALQICLQGIEQQQDHHLSLIERVFYYFPLLHSENIQHQQGAINAYQVLLDTSLPETRIIYQSFLKFAQQHFSVVSRFGRFPQRNPVLGRESTEKEIKYLEDLK